MAKEVVERALVPLAAAPQEVGLVRLVHVGSSFARSCPSSGVTVGLVHRLPGAPGSRAVSCPALVSS